MRTLLIALLCAAFPLWSDEVPEPPVAEETPQPEVDTAKLSETLGHLLVRQLDTPEFSFDYEKVVKGIQDELAGKPSPLDEEEFQMQMAAVQEKVFQEMADKNLTAAESFLKENEQKKGVISVDPQLQYKVLAKGKGKKVTADATPLVHYTGKLLDGTTFASSYETEQPISLPMSQSIPGFSKGLVGMKEGEKRILYIHPELAYGVSGHLPPNSLLIFEVEIVNAGDADLPTDTAERG